MFEEFDRLPWHEAKLLGLRIGSRDEAQQATVYLDVAFDARHRIPPKRIAFLRCTCIAVKCDLDYMRVMGDVIHRAKHSSAETLKEFVREPGDTSLYRHFSVDFVAPAGSIELFAQTVVIQGLEVP